MAPKVICLGEALVDRLGPLGGDPASAAPEQCDDRLGGAPANVACALAQLGTASAFVGRLGCDPIGEAFERLMVARGVELAGLQHDPTRPSRVVLVRRHADGERVFQGFQGHPTQVHHGRDQGFADQALEVASLQQAWPQLAAQASWLLAGTIPLATPQSAEALQWAVDAALAGGLRLALDVNWRPTFWHEDSDPSAGPDAAAQEVMAPLLRRASLLKLAREEAQWLFGSTDPVVISAALPQAPDVVVTDGAHPLRWLMDGAHGSLAVLAPPAVVDTTGAGDAFSAGLLHQLVQAEVQAQPPEPELMLRFAAACGALVCAGAGAIDPQPDARTVDEFLRWASSRPQPQPPNATGWPAGQPLEPGGREA